MYLSLLLIGNACFIVHSQYNGANMEFVDSGYEIAEKCQSQPPPISANGDSQLSYTNEVGVPESDEGNAQKKAGRAPLPEFAQVLQGAFPTPQQLLKMGGQHLLNLALSGLGPQ